MSAGKATISAEVRLKGGIGGKKGHYKGTEVGDCASYRREMGLSG
jgi:hypothetical protein